MNIKRVLRGLLGAAVCAAVGSCKHSSSGTGPGGEVIQVLITPSTAAIGVGKTVALHATVTGPSGISQIVTWQSLSPAVATVSGTGVVTGVAEGTSIIKAAWFEDATEFATIQVQVTTVVIGDSGAVRAIRAVKR